MSLMKYLLFLIVLMPQQNIDWELVKEKDNIKVYTRKLPDMSYEQIRILAIIKAPITEIVCALEDVPHHKNWVYETTESKFLNKTDQTNFDYYIKMNMPFPVKDRDVVIKYTRKQDKATKVVDIKSIAIEKGPEKINKVIRIEDFTSTYKLTPLANGLVEVDYFMSADPGGTMPAWVVNMFTTKGPLATMEALIELMASGQYEGKKAHNITE